MRALAITCIELYQRYLSPHKGYSCAYRHHTGRCGCSGLGLRAIRRYGTLRGLGVLRRRLHLCGVAYRRHATRHKRPHRGQRGDCDCGLPLDCGLDAGSCSTVADAADCCAGVGDCGWSNSKKTKEQDVYIPPNSLRGAQRKKISAAANKTKAIPIKTTSAAAPSAPDPANRASTPIDWRAFIT